MEKLEFIIKAKEDFNNEFNSLKGHLSSLPGIAAIAAGAMASLGGAIFAMTKSAADAYDVVNDLSLRLGVTTEFISKMNHAAQMSGMTSEEMAVSLRLMTVKLGEASQGNEKAKEAFDNLGVSIRDANGKVKTTEELMPDVAEGFNRLESSAQRAAVANDIFGRQGASMIPILAGGREGLQDLWQEAEKFGLVMSTKAARNAAEMNDAIDRMKGAGLGLRNAFAEGLFPVFSQGFNSMANLVANNRERITKWAEVAVYGFSKAAEIVVVFGGVVADTFRAAHVVWEGAKAAIAGLAGAIAKAMSWAAEKVAGFLEAMNFGGIWDTEIQGLRSFSSHFKMFGEGLGEVAGKAAGEVQTYWENGMAASTKAMVGFVDEFKRGMAETGGSVGGGGEEGEGGGTTLGDKSDNKDKEKDKIQAEYDELLSMHAEYTTSKEEQLAAWYEKELELFQGNKDAQRMAEEVYLAQMDEIKTAEWERAQEVWAENCATEEEQLTAWYEKQRTLYQGNKDAMDLIDQAYEKKKGVWQKKQDDTTVKDRKLFYTNMETIGRAFGQKAFAIAQAFAIPEAVMNAFTAASNALADVRPYPLNIVAAAAALAAGMAQVANVRSVTMGAAHGGLDFVPEDNSTYVLKRGERVLAPRQNEDLTAFLEGGARGPNIEHVTVEMHILENASNGDALLRMDRRDWVDVVEEKIIPALNELSRIGIQPA